MKRKYFKRALTIAICIVMGGTMFTGCTKSKAQSEEKISEEYAGSINVWSWNNELLTSGMIKKFNEVYPNINVNLIAIPTANNAYSTKLIATLRSGVNAPDVYLAESATVKKLCNMEFYEDLSKEPYNAEALTEKMVPYTVELGRNDKDKSIRALTWQATPGGYFYKRSLAKKYLGTDDPKEVQKMMTTMKDFTELGKKIKNASANKVSLLAKYSELQSVALANRNEGWIKDGKLVIDPAMLEYLDLASQIRNEALDINVQQWTKEWTEAMSGDEVFGFMLPTWGLSILKANAPKTEGDWAFIQAPSPYFWGGTWMGMYKYVNNKDLSWLFIKFLTTNEEFMTQYAKDSGDYVNNTEVQNNISNSDEGNNKFLNGQNAYKAYTSLVGDIKGDTLSEYDESINVLWSTSTELYISGKMTKEDAIMNFKKTVKEAFPKLKIE